jgi:hypothetical protein
MPADLKAKIESWARKHARSINSEIVGRLVDSVEESARPLRSYSDGDLIRELLERYGRGQITIRIGEPDDQNDKGAAG